jgi:hypothetical protein
MVVSLSIYTRVPAGYLLNIYLRRKVVCLFCFVCTYEIHRTGMLHIAFLMSVESSRWWGVRGHIGHTSWFEQVFDWVLEIAPKPLTGGLTRIRLFACAWRCLEEDLDIQVKPKARGLELYPTHNSRKHTETLHPSSPPPHTHHSSTWLHSSWAKRVWQLWTGTDN